MERLTRRTEEGCRLAEGVSAAEALERLAGYEDAHAFLRQELDRAAARVEAMKGQGRGKGISFQQALAEKLFLMTLVDRLEHPPGSTRRR